MQRFSAIRTIAAVLVLVVAASCGGGGGPSGPGRPVITAGTPSNGATGVAYPGYTFTIASGGLAPFTWSEAGPLPPGLALSPDGQLTGTPVTAGDYSVTIIVSDSSVPALTGNLSVSVSISDSPIVVSSTPQPPGGVVTNLYAGGAFRVASGGSPPFTWTVTSGGLPNGLALATNGALTGTPTSTGTFSFTVTATDSAQTPATGSHQFSIQVNPPAALVVNPTPTPYSGIHGSPYTFNFTATGGYLPLAWAITAGALPPGLSMASDGTLSGTPTISGTSGFTITATDSATMPAQSATAFSITVTDPPPPAIVNGPPPTATVGTAYSFLFTESGGLAPVVWSQSGAPQGLGIDVTGLLSGTPGSAGHFPITVSLTDALNRSAPPGTFTIRVSTARPASVFTPTGSMAIARSGHTATLLNTGKVLITGGANASAELYDPASGSFAATGSMSKSRTNHTATLLADGKVLVLGSVDNTAELYDPVAGTFSATGSMTTARTQPVATLLNTGKVLITGGNTVAGDLTAELYDPATGTFAATGSTTVLRIWHTATLLSDGKVLLAGGRSGLSAPWVQTAELYDPSTAVFTATANMTVARAGHTALRLSDGTVLLVGPTATAELYDPATGMFSVAGNPLFPSGGYTASLRSDGSVIVTGGYTFDYFHSWFLDALGVCHESQRPGQFALSSPMADIFGPESGGFTLAGYMLTARTGGHTATTLPDGTVLIAGGTQQTVGQTGPARCQTPTSVATPLSSAERLE